MALRRQRLLKVVAGIMLVLLAAFVTVFIKDALSVQNPEHALPELSVYFNGTAEDRQLPYEHIRRDRYTWKFMFWPPVAGGGLDLEAWREIKPGYVDPGAALDLAFSFAPREVRVYSAAGESEFVEQPVAGLRAPGTPGKYAYRVEAAWGADRVVQYYFRIEIPVW